MGTSLAGRHALVCGASQGIGLACAEALAAEGATLTLLSRSSATLETARAGLSGGGHHCLACDMSDWTATGEAVAAHVADTGPVHILVHNSGGPKGGPLIDATPEDLLAGLSDRRAELLQAANQMRPRHRGEWRGRGRLSTRTLLNRAVFGGPFGQPAVEDRDCVMAEIA